MLSRLLLQNSKLTSTSLSLVSQLLGILQLILLITKVGPGRETDTYFYIFAIGLVFPQIFIDGFISPAMLRGRLSAKSINKIMVLCLILIFIFNFLAYLKIRSNGNNAAIYVIIVLMLNSLVQFVNWFYASVKAVFGIPFFKSGMFIPANSLGVIMLLMPEENSYQNVLNMCIGLLIGNLAFLFAIKLNPPLRSEFNNLVVLNSSGNYYWLLVKSFCSYFGILGIQTIAFDLKASAITFLAIPGKIVSGFTSIFINSILPFHVNVSVFNELKMKTTIWRYLLFSTLISLISIIVFLVFFPEYFLFSIVISVWLVSSVGSSFAQVIVLKKLPPGAVIFSIFPIFLVYALLITMTRFNQIDILALFIAFALIDALSASIQFIQIRYWQFAGVFTLTSLVLLVSILQFLF